MTFHMDKYRKMSDSDLIAAVRDGDDRAFNALFLRWYPQVERFILSLVKDAPLAEDLAQGVFMKVWLYRDRLNPSLSLKNYLAVLSRNAALDVFKSKRHLMMADTDTPVRKPAPEHTEFQAEYNEAHFRITELIDKMPPQRRLIFQLSRYEQLSHEQIATQLGISVRTVEKHIQLALQELRKHLN
jgi:RNA polymerase sigma-70 factor (ECF subfamily)